MAKTLIDVKRGVPRRFDVGWFLGEPARIVWLAAGIIDP
jgi:hypothetical protein